MIKKIFGKDIEIEDYIQVKEKEKELTGMEWVKVIDVDYKNTFMRLKTIYGTFKRPKNTKILVERYCACEQIPVKRDLTPEEIRMKLRQYQYSIEKFKNGGYIDDNGNILPVEVIHRGSKK